jgi:DNA (cytosine-5)-methyltransferase 1
MSSYGSRQFTYGSVCSGIEAATVAWEPLGWQAAWFAEIDPFCCALLQHRYPKVKNYGDLTQIGSDAGPIDLLVGGTPCQSFSVAGRRGGLDDARGNLAVEFIKLAGRLLPDWIVWENVPGVLSIDGGWTFGTILGSLAELGYGVAYRVLDAQFFGVPQRRRRVFVAGYLGDWRCAAAVLFEGTSLSGNPAPRREAGQNIAPTLSARTRGGGGLGTDFDCDGGLIVYDSGRLDFESETFVAHTLRSAVRRLTPRECERLQGFSDDYTLIPWRGKPARDGPRYKAIGNSMAVPVMRWIGRRIQMLRGDL